MEQKRIFIDLDYCIGCRACEVACKQEHDIPVGVKWINVIQVGPKMIGNKLRMDFVPMKCRHCAKAPCMDACPEDAISKRSDGIVLIDEEACTGCLACVDVCPFGSIQMNPKTMVAEKCTLCVHRVDAGIEPACVHTCPSKCMHFGDVNELVKIRQVREAERGLENPVLVC
jgi:Fe-S-cluster-containing dehydrogenase component